MSNVLDKICADKRLHIAACAQAVPESALRERAHAQSAPRGFHRAIKATIANGRQALIAEIKKASPSKGLIRADFDPPSLARAYQDGGATCLSVLTDIPYFQGSDAYLVAARAACTLPVLRKDFMLAPYQVTEARALGADCILLIMAALSDAQARELEEAAIALGMDVLVEVHNEAEAERALLLRSRLIGVNNRDLTTLSVDLGTTERIAGLLPREATVVSESGIYTPADLAGMNRHGVRAFLVGESLMKQADVAAATRALLAPAPTSPIATAAQ